MPRGRGALLQIHPQLKPEFGRENFKNFFRVEFGIEDLGQSENFRCKQRMAQQKAAMLHDGTSSTPLGTAHNLVVDRGVGSAGWLQ